MKRFSLPQALHDFFFAQMDARGFRLMRVGWAVTALVVMLPFITRITVLFAETKTLQQTILVYPYAWSMFFWITTPAAVTFFYAVLVAACLAMIAGYRPAIATIVAVFLFTSFAERNIEVFHTEATLLRLFGFILVLASFSPGYAAPAVRGKPAPRRTIPVWLYRLLYWQVVMLYLATGWHKVISPFWTSGDAVQAILHWEYSRLTPEQADLFKPFSFFLSWSVIIWELAWVLLFVPLWSMLGKRARPLRGWGKRGLIIVGIVMHVSWAILLNRDILPLSLAMIAAYCGLLTADDWALLRPAKKPARRAAPQKRRGRR